MTDASPWGLGAVALRHGIPIRHFVSDLTRHDYERDHHQEGDSAGQQVWEALAILVTMMAWSDLSREGKFTICLEGDNVTALLMALRLQSPPGGVKEIARELALELTKASFAPIIVEHIPGTANEVADVLSRRRDPSRAQTWRLPPVLADLVPTTVPVRDSSYYFL